ncbi:MAG TPA: hypothetical protein VFU27_13420 [Terriglobales bacterium]|nr:hypothetical protein [Terriglobales bacterium]
MADVKNNSGSLSDEELVLAALEPDQLAEAKKQRIPRRRLRRGEAVVLWLLRIYLLFMLAVVVYQVWTGGH